MNLQTLIEQIQQALSNASIAECAFMKPFARPGTTVVDVGANVGLITEPLSRFVGQDGRVLSIEPGPKAYKELVQNTNNLWNVTTFNVALGDKKETARFFHSYYWTLLPASDPKALDENKKYAEPFIHLKENAPIDIEVRLLDDLVESEIDVATLGYPNLIKVDTDGWEAKVLRGGIRCLRAGAPFYIELGDFCTNQVGDAMIDVVTMFLDNGYTFLPYDTNVHALPRTVSAIMDQPCWKRGVHTMDVLAVREKDLFHQLSVFA